MYLEHTPVPFLHMWHFSHHFRGFFKCNFLGPYPIPNIAEYTGRGIHLVWCIQQVSAKLDWMVREVSRHYAQMIQSLLQNIGILGYQVDMGYAPSLCVLCGLTSPPTVAQTELCSTSDSSEVLRCPAVKKNRKTSLSAALRSVFCIHNVI